MTGKDLFAALSFVDDALILEAEEAKPARRTFPAQAAQEIGEQTAELAQCLLSAAVRAGHAGRKLIRERNDVRTALCGVQPVQPVAGEVAAELRQKGEEVRGPSRRNRIPRAEVRVVHALLGVLPHGQQAARKAVQPRPVFDVRLLNGRRVARPVQREDPLVFQHFTAPFLPFTHKVSISPRTVTKLLKK